MTVELAEDDDPLSDRCWEHVPYHPYLRPGPKAAARVSVVPPSAFPVRILGYVGGNRRSPPVLGNLAQLATAASADIYHMGVSQCIGRIYMGILGSGHLPVGVLSLDRKVGSLPCGMGNLLTLRFLQAHDQPIRSMVWSHNDSWMVTDDDEGAIKYWQNNMNNVKANKTSPMMQVLKVWDFARCQEERALFGGN